MRELRGIAAAGSIVLGPAHLLAARVVVRKATVGPHEEADELKHLQSAFETADRQLAHAQDRLAEAGHPEAIDVVVAHRLMLESKSMRANLVERVREGHCTAEWAVRQEITRLESTFSAMTDSYLRGRRDDVEAMGERLLRILTGMPERQHRRGQLENAIAVGDSLFPEDILRLHADGVVGVATRRGGGTSHTAILARSVGMAYVPGIESLDLGEITPGDMIALDGHLGRMVVRPSRSTRTSFEDTRRAREKRASELKTLRALPASTLDDVRIRLSANVEDPADVALAIADGVDSVGLVRTELLHLATPGLPTEETQFADAREIVRAARGRPVTFRTLDLSSDKTPGRAGIAEGANPALGLRGIRRSLRRPDEFRAQLRALYRASACGPVRIMFPMISDVLDLRAAQALCAEVVGALAAEGIDHDPGVPLGAMIETPSAAIASDLIVKECDFLSIGTNDLVQYVCAADRDDASVGAFYQSLHPAVLRLIGTVIGAADTAGKPVSLCGEIAGDPFFTWILMGLGLRCFSIHPRQLPPVKSAIRRARLSVAERLAREAIGCASAKEVEMLIFDRTGTDFDSAPGPSVEERYAPCLDPSPPPP